MNDHPLDRPAPSPDQPAPVDWSTDQTAGATKKQQSSEEPTASAAADAAPDASSERPKSPRPATESEDSSRTPSVTRVARKSLGDKPARTIWRKRIKRYVIPPVVVILVGALVGAAVAATIHVPEAESIAEFSPGLITELFDDRGGVFKTYSTQSRIMLSEDEIPELLERALLSAEDSRFYQHGGIDIVGVARSLFRNWMMGRRAYGASTLTMQLAGTHFLDRTQDTWDRKIREAFYAVELEKTLSKRQILALYCNLMYLGHSNYGFQAAARYYFDKDVSELDLPETATLVAVAKRPTDWSPIRKPELVRTRRNLVLDRMLDEGAITADQHANASQSPLVVASRSQPSSSGAYLSEEVRRYLYATYGEKGLYERGLKVTTTLDQQAQKAAERALRRGLVRIDERRGWRGPIETFEPDRLQDPKLANWRDIELRDGAWVQGVATEVSAAQAKVRILDEVVTLEASGYEWTKVSDLRRLLEPGSVAWFELSLRDEFAQEEPATADPSAAVSARDDAEQSMPTGADSSDLQTGAAQEDDRLPPSAFTLTLRQEPELEGAVVVMNAKTGAVRAMVGGWDFQRNEFNRATQARRQPGSAFKPFVFGAAFEVGFTPADTLFDAPVVFAGADNLPSYSPRNFYREYEGIITLRQALEKSVNVSSVKLQDLVGVDRVVDFARRSGIESPLPPYPSLALGAAELTPLELAAAYAAFANNGIHIEPYLVESVATPDGKLLEAHQPRAARAMSNEVAFLLVHTLRGVVLRGTATSARRIEVPIAGKTGTTDGFTDAWFAGFTPDTSVVVWVGYDKKRSLGRNMTGAEAALPIWREIVSTGVEEGWLQAGAGFVPPPRISFRRVEANTGLIATPEAESVISEAFLAGSEPVQEYSLRWRQIMELPWYQQRAFYGRPKEGEKMPEDISDWSLVENLDDSD